MGWNNLQEECNNHWEAMNSPLVDCLCPGSVMPFYRDLVMVWEDVFQAIGTLGSKVTSSKKQNTWESTAMGVLCVEEKEERSSFEEMETLIKGTTCCQEPPLRRTMMAWWVRCLMAIGDNLLMDTWLRFCIATVTSNRTHLFYLKQFKQVESECSMTSLCCWMKRPRSLARVLRLALVGWSSELCLWDPKLLAELRAMCYGSARQASFQTSTVAKKFLIEK